MRFAKTAFSSTIWLSDSALQARSSAGFHDSRAFPFVVTTYFSTKSHSSAISYSLSSAFHVSSVHFGAVSISSANFVMNPAVVTREVFCSRRIMSPMQTSDICINSELSKFRDSPVPISVAAVKISFADAVRLDDVSASLVSPTCRSFVLMRNSCFGCFENCGQSRDSVFAFQSPPALGMNRVPPFLCQNYGDYAG